MENANNRQIAGNHYKSNIQHWDYVIANDLDYFQAQITKYVTRWKKKNGITDLEKAKHFLEKYIESQLAKSRGSLFERGPLPTKVTRIVTEQSGQQFPFGFDAAKDI